MKLKVLATMCVIAAGSNVYASSNASFVNRMMNLGSDLPKPLAEIDSTYLDGQIGHIVHKGIEIKDNLIESFK